MDGYMANNGYMNGERGLNSEETDWYDLLPVTDGLGLNASLLESMSVNNFVQPSAMDLRALMTSKTENSFIVRSANAVNNRIALSLAFLQRMNKERFYATLCIVASHIEAKQAFGLIQPLAKFMDLKVCLCSMQTSIKDDICSLKDGKHIIVATPGRLYDLITIRAFPFECVDVICVLEIDAFMTNGYQKCLQKIYSTLEKTIKIYVGTDSIEMSTIMDTFPKKFFEFKAKSEEMLNVPIETDKLENGATSDLHISDDDNVSAEEYLSIDTIEKVNEDKVIEDKSSRVIEETVSPINEETNDTFFETNDKNEKRNETVSDEDRWESAASTESVESEVEIIKEIKPVDRCPKTVRLLEPFVSGCDEFISNLPMTQTGSYITHAAILKVDSSSDSGQVVVVAASHNRTQHLLKVIKDDAKDGIRCEMVYQHDSTVEERRRSMNAHIVVGTPGLMENLLPNVAELRTGKRLNARLVVFDGIDFMLQFKKTEMKLLQILEALKDDVQILLTGAKVTTESLLFIGSVFEKKLKRVSLERLFLVVGGEDSKFTVVCNILNFKKKTVIACSNSSPIALMAKSLKETGISSIKLDETTPRNQGIQLINSFNNLTNCRVLITTYDMLLNLKNFNIPVVINYDSLNATSDCYLSNQLQISGRTVLFNFMNIV